MTLELPGVDERGRILARYLAPFGLPQHPLALLAESFATASPALIRQWCEGLKRNLVIGPRLNWDMSRAAVITRLLATVGPHPDLGKPRLWSLGADDAAVRGMPWPLQRAEDIAKEPEVAMPVPASKVVKLRAGAE